MMTVSVEALRDRHDGFQIANTVGCFWRTLYKAEGFPRATEKSLNLLLGRYF
jgi:hypothetical protein